MTQTLAEPLFDLTEAINNLITEDDEPVDNILSEKQQRLLTETLYSSWTPSPEEDNPVAPRSFWASANVGVFFSVHEPPLVPDVFISLDVVPPADMKAKTGRSYLFWEQGKAPEVVVEIVSNKKGGELDHKLREYARRGVYHYVVFDPFQHLSDEVLRIYEPGLPRRYSLRSDYQLPGVGLSLTLWAGRFEGHEYGGWLRWRDASGNLLPTPDESKARAVERANRETERANRETERANQEAERANQEAERATKAEERAARLAVKLRELGLDPEQL